MNIETEAVRHAEDARYNAHWYNSSAKSFRGAVSGDELARAREAAMSEFEAPEADPAEADPDEAAITNPILLAYRASGQSAYDFYTGATVDEVFEALDTLAELSQDEIEGLA